ncbi:LANO_0H24014g1_1 [Lachancea nothofagi CBS 11611]|uniref:DASH complex subunit DAD2 n=1 Tax=Lachancea nothofagi CBS 11611 TaxID=1266666 RepID=A0A1G4KNR6_9SACH|nr:LANO_0H24014g1_1 [Lachancea nothofagi CBS 11611]
MTLERDIAAKQKELEALKKINALTASMRQQLDSLAVEVTKMHENAESVANVMSNWDSIIRSISQASLSLLQYSERDYEVGVWDQENNVSKKKPTTPQDLKEAPLPETLVRVKVDNDQDSGGLN